MRKYNVVKICLQCGGQFRRKYKGGGHFSKQKYCSEKCKGIAHRVPAPRCSVCNTIVSRNDCKFCRTCWKRQLHGETVSAWKGGLTPINLRIRRSDRYTNWRTKVFERDDYTCQECGARGCKLNAHHLVAFSRSIELRFALSNGITLCEPCHWKTDNYASKACRSLRG